MRRRVLLAVVLAIVVGIVLFETLTDGPPRPRLVPVDTVPDTPTSSPATITAAVVYRPRSLPTGFALAFERGDGAAGEAYLLHYERANGDGAADTVDVLTVAGATSETDTRSDADVRAEKTTVKVRGHPATEVTTTLEGTVRTLTWLEEPDVRLRVVATGEITVEELRSVAESVAPDPGPTAGSRVG